MTRKLPAKLVETRVELKPLEKRLEERWRDWFNRLLSVERLIDWENLLILCIFTHSSFICVILMLFFFFYLLFDLEKSLNGIINYFRNDGRWTIGNGEEDLRFFSPSRVGIKIYETKDFWYFSHRVIWKTWLGIKKRYSRKIYLRKDIE